MLQDDALAIRIIAILLKGPSHQVELVAPGGWGKVARPRRHFVVLQAERG